MVWWWRCYSLENNGKREGRGMSYLGVREGVGKSYLPRTQVYEQ